VGYFFAMRYADAIRYLYSLGNEVLTAKLGLQNISTLLQVLHDPHQEFRSILIAGTNGKGSVAAFVESVLRASGVKTGLYTSPHLVRIEERIQVSGKAIGESDFARLTQLIKDNVTLLLDSHQGEVGQPRLDRHPTYFEMVTAIAFSYFAEQRVDIAVLEVGLGGRFDATNVVDPLVAVVTNVDFDHQQYLGNRLEQIAFEKAGIIKPRSYQGSDPLPVVCSSKEPTVREIIQSRCRAAGAHLFTGLDGIEFRAEPDALGRFRLELNAIQGASLGLQIPLPGEHQVENALTAIQALMAIQSETVIEPGILKQGIEATRWPGRLEIVGERPRLIVDGAHNPAGAEAVRKYCRQFLRDRGMIMVFGALRDKPVVEMGRTLFPLAQEIILTRIASERAIDPRHIAESLPEFRSRYVFSSSAEQALDAARIKAGEDKVILVVGSLFLVGEIQEALKLPSLAG
jgi:dihydrofolate synthase / folylpolyglutamate synthase